MLELYNDITLSGSILSETNSTQSDQKPTLSDQKTTQSSQQNDQGSPTSSQKVLDKIQETPQITISQLAIELAMSPSGIKKILKKLKDSGQIKRVGADKGGYWKILNHEL